MRRAWIAAALLAASMAALLLWMGRPPICRCGTVELWTGAVHSAENSQHLADWYTPSHVLHGFLFYWLGWLLLRRTSNGTRFAAAAALEAAWEVVENSRFVIDRYREATIAFGYSGDSVINSLADLGWMLLGWQLAARLPVRATVAIAILFELLTLFVIRDNLTLNVVMLLAPIEAIRDWQAGG
jgi:hypothetical protein